MRPEKSNPIRHHVQLAGGRLIEVVYFDRRSSQEAPGAPDPLHVCFYCASELVYPLAWSEEAAGRWWIHLRCPDCESQRDGVFEHAAVQLFDDELDRATGALLGDLKRMTHANMSGEIELFVRALDLDLIEPNDFDR